MASVSSSDCRFKERINGLLDRGRQAYLLRRIAGRSLLKATDPAGYDLWATPNGEYWVPKGNPALLPLVLAMQQRGIYGEVRPGSIVLDCGANVGAYAREALAQGAKLVVEIEPVPENIECLRRNLAAEIARGAVVIYPKGVWDHETMLPMHRDPGNSAPDSFVGGSPLSTQAPLIALTTVDKIVEELKLATVDHIKINIEGAEQRALAGARRTLALHRLRLAVAVNHVPDDPEKVPALIRQAWPHYRSGCGGSCFVQQGRFYPEILYFE